MHVQKVSISLSKQQCEFIERYQDEHHLKTRSEVIKKAIYLLQQKQLESYYRQANKEIDSAFDVTDADGIENETW